MENKTGTVKLKGIVAGGGIISCVSEGSEIASIDISTLQGLTENSQRYHKLKRLILANYFECEEDDDLWDLLRNCSSESFDKVIDSLK